jgi:NADH-quinone oxidoreductase subunit C
VHWPAGDHIIERQSSTTGWPEYRVSREQGMIEVLYILRSLTRNHWFRVSVATPDDAPRLPSVTTVFPTANYHEREVYDFFGVEFEGHPDLTRILMPDDWIGHPHRKDYPLGGVDIPYKNDKFIPPPEERDLREVID